MLWEQSSKSKGLIALIFSAGITLVISFRFPQNRIFSVLVKTASGLTSKICFRISPNVISPSRSTMPQRIGSLSMGKALVRRIGYCFPGLGSGIETFLMQAVLTLSSKIWVFPSNCRHILDSISSKVPHSMRWALTFFCFAYVISSNTLFFAPDILGTVQNSP